MRKRSARRISPAERRDLAAQQAQQRGLAAAIGANQAYAHSRGDDEVQILEKAAVPEL